MLFDWFTVAAQALNFLILVLLMRRFLYKPIVHAIDEREKLIASKLANADATMAEAQQERDEFEHKQEELDQHRTELLTRATLEASVERKRLLDDARQAADAQGTKWKERLRNDAHNLNQAIGSRTQQEVFAVARKALTELAGASLEDRLGEVFIRRLGEMESQAKATLGKALKTATDPALVRSAFGLAPDQRSAIQVAINEAFAADIPLRFEIAPDLVSGIELTTNGLSVGWSIAEYLTSLEDGVSELLKDEDKPEAKSERKAGARAEPIPEEAAPELGRP